MRRSRVLVLLVPMLAACGIGAVGTLEAPAADAGPDATTAVLPEAAASDAPVEATPDATDDAPVDAAIEADADAGADVCVPRVANAVSWWPGDGDRKDAVGSNDGANGTQNGATAVTYGPGKVGQAFALNGTSYVQVPNAASLQITAALTLEAWIYPTALGGARRRQDHGRHRGRLPPRHLREQAAAHHRIGLRLQHREPPDQRVGPRRGHVGRSERARLRRRRPRRDERRDDPPEQQPRAPHRRRQHGRESLRRIHRRGRRLQPRPLDRRDRRDRPRRERAPVPVKRALLAALLLVGCKKTQIVCPDPEGSITYEREEQAKKAAAKNPTFCDELRRPSVSLEGDWLTLGGRRLVGRPELSTQKLTHVASLTEPLRRMREQWKVVHPGRSFESDLDVRIDPQIETVRAVSVLGDAAYYGYPTMRVTAGAIAFAGTWWLPGPPDGNPPILGRLTIDSGEERFHIEARGPKCAVERRTIAQAELAETVRAFCKKYVRERPDAAWGGESPPPEYGRCFDVVLVKAHPRTPFAVTASRVKTALEALADQKPAPEVTIFVLGSGPRYPDVETSRSCPDDPSEAL